MPDSRDLVEPEPGAPPQTWAAYQPAHNQRAMHDRHQQLEKLNAELRAKLRHAECERAMAAFNRVLAAAGIDPFEAASAQHKLEAWDDTGFPKDAELTEADYQAAKTWREAIEAGRAELCDKPPYVSEAAFALVGFLDEHGDESSKYVFALRLQST